MSAKSGENLHKEKMAGADRFLVLVFLLMVQHVTTQQSNQKKIWLIAIGDSFGAHEYRTAQGYLKGFAPDLIDAVCLEGNMDCRLVSAPYTDCWITGADTHPYGGTGLLSKWFDACSSWVPTVERIHVFRFTRQYMKPRNTYFFTLKSDTSFDPKNLDGKKIGFITGWASNEQCIARQDNIQNNILTGRAVYRDTVDQLFTALERGDVHAVFLTVTAWTAEQAAKVRQVPGLGVRCLLHGTSLMARRDSDFIAHWNNAFTKFATSSDKFQQFCNETNLKHSAKGPGVDCTL